MAKVYVKDYEMEAIGDALREANVTEDGYLPSEMPDAILDAMTKFAPKNMASGESIAVTDAEEWKPLGMTVYGKSTQNTVAGNQLCNTYNIHERTINGITITQDNGRLILNGTATALLDIYCVGSGVNTDMVERINTDLGTYRLSNNLGLENLVYATTTGYSANTVTITSENQFVNCFVRILSGRTFNNSVLEIMLNSGTTALPWEPYVGGIPSPNPEYPQEIVSCGDDGSVEYTFNSQTLTLQTPNGFPGIPLGSTIPDGIKNSEIHMSGVWWDDKTSQYYISDTVDVSRGKYVKRIGVYEDYLKNNTILHSEHLFRFITAFSDMRIQSYLLCNLFIQGNTASVNHTISTFRGNGNVPHFRIEECDTVDDLKTMYGEKIIRVWYELKVPLETDLTEEEIAQYKALMMNSPNTTILNDSGVYTEVTYLPLIQESEVS